VAPSYGNAQNILGPALRPHRNRVYLACKTGIRTKDGALRELQESLKLLHTDYFDVYQLHGVNPDEVDAVLGPGGALETLRAAKKEGLVRNIGFSSHHNEAAVRLMAGFSFDTVLFPINWACMIKNGLGVPVLQEAARQNMGRLAIKGLGHRAKEPAEDGYPNCWYRPILDDPALAGLALRFTLSRDVHTAVSPGDVRMLRLGLSILEKYQGRSVPPDAEELAALRSKAAEVEHPVFG
jgi:predicted aldo/keto reductase-like oxidoreductase